MLHIVFGRCPVKFLQALAGAKTEARALVNPLKFRLFLVDFLFAYGINVSRHIAASLKRNDQFYIKSRISIDKGEPDFLVHLRLKLPEINRVGEDPGPAHAV